MNEKTLKVGDTLVFDHSDYKDYCIVYAVNEDGTEGKMACVDDGGGTDCLWLLNVKSDENGNLTTYQGREVERDPELLSRVDECLDEDSAGMETLLMILFEQAAFTPEDISIYPDDDMDDISEELSILHNGWNEIRNTNKTFDDKYQMLHFN